MQKHARSGVFLRETFSCPGAMGPSQAGKVSPAFLGQQLRQLFQALAVPLIKAG